MNDMQEDYRRQLRAVVEAGQTGRVSPAAAVRARGEQRRHRQAAGVGALVVLFAGLGAGGFLLKQPGGHSPAPAPPAAAAPDPTTAASASPLPPGGARWAGHDQFMQVQRAAVVGGRLVLSVRVATKRDLGESFETVPGPGPFTDVAASPNVVVKKLDGTTQPAATFLTDLARRKNPVEAFTVRFGPDGLVTSIDWLYNL
jgi:hypothetical protein